MEEEKTMAVAVTRLVYTDSERGNDNRITGYNLRISYDEDSLRRDLESDYKLFSREGSTGELSVLALYPAVSPDGERRLWDAVRRLSKGEEVDLKKIRL